MTHHTESTRTRLSSTGTGTATAVIVKGVLRWRRVTQALTNTGKKLRDSVSAQGWFVPAVAVVGITLGLSFGWAEFVVAGFAALALCILALPFLFGAKSYRVTLKLAHERIVVGDAAAGTLTVENVGKRIALPGVIDLPVGDGLIELEVPLLRGSAVQDEEVSIPGHRRGIISIGPASTVRRDPLGLFRRERTWQEAETLYVHPQTLRLPSMSSGLIRDLEGQASRTIVTDDLSFHAIREYQAGDSRRQVHWKSTAKTGKLMVRQYEETRRSGISIVLASREDEFRDPDEFELAVSVVGSLALRGIHDGRDVECAVSDEIPEFARETYGRVSHIPARSPRMILDHLAGIVSLPRMHTLPEVARLVGGNTQSASIAFLVCGSSLTAADIQRAAFAFPANVTVLTIICDQHAEPKVWTVGGKSVLSVAILDDLAHLFVRGLSG